MYESTYTFTYSMSCCCSFRLVRSCIVIQKTWRGRKGRERVEWRKRSIVRVQCCVRVWRAKRQLKVLKVLYSIYIMIVLNIKCQHIACGITTATTVSHDKMLASSCHSTINSLNTCLFFPRLLCSIPCYKIDIYNIPPLATHGIYCHYDDATPSDLTSLQ